MVYVQVKSRVILTPEETLKVQHVADVRSNSPEETKRILQMPVKCVSSPGIWKIPAIHVLETIAAAKTDGMMPLGGVEYCYVHIIPQQKQNRLHILRSVLAFFLLFFGSLLAICWFHADVNMAQAQQTMFQILTGKENAPAFMLSIPYAIGVFMGVSLFYALLGRKGTISPLDIKMNEYHTTSEQAAGKIP